MRWQTVLFDLDGTLIDSVPLILASHRHATATVLGEALPDDVLRAGIGKPLLTQMRTFDEERAQELLDTYRTFNHAQHDSWVVAFDGMLELLAELRAGGAAVGVVTSKGAVATAMAYRIVPLAPQVDVLVTADDVDAHKPEPEPLLHALAQLGRAREGAVYVGDAPADVQAARAAGIDGVAVTWGAFPREILEGEEPLAVCDTPAELRDILLAHA